MNEGSPQRRNQETCYSKYQSPIKEETFDSEELKIKILKYEDNIKSIHKTLEIHLEINKILINECEDQEILKVFNKISSLFQNNPEKTLYYDKYKNIENELIKIKNISKNYSEQPIKTLKKKNNKLKEILKMYDIQLNQIIKESNFNTFNQETTEKNKEINSPYKEVRTYQNKE